MSGGAEMINELDSRLQLGALPPSFGDRLSSVSPRSKGVQLEM
jgi:hypothetical protein